jgi:hypothetical protein
MNNLIVNLIKRQCSINRVLATNNLLSNHSRIISQNVIKRNFAAKPKQQDDKNVKPNCNVGELIQF